MFVVPGENRHAYAEQQQWMVLYFEERFKPVTDVCTVTFSTTTAVVNNAINQVISTSLKETVKQNVVIKPTLETQRYLYVCAARCFVNVMVSPLLGLTPYVSCYKQEAWTCVTSGLLDDWML